MVSGSVALQSITVKDASGTNIPVMNPKTRVFIKGRRYSHKKPVIAMAPDDVAVETTA